MNYFESKDKTLCCGCTACASVCPVQCISMEEDKNGFLYPNINKDKCINCGACIKVCPLADDKAKKLSNKAQETCYAFENLNKEDFDNSTSGGAFTAIVKAFCDSNYIVYGAAYDNNMVVKHTYIEDIKDINIFRNSKYFQSEIGNSFAEIKNFLKNGKKVLFSGTPCQIAGLKSFLKKDYENLLLIDLMCFGVPSKKAFLSYKNYLEKKYNDKLIGYKFRVHKENCIIATFEKKGDKKISTTTDYFMKAFYSKYLFRDCCQKCQFKNMYRQGDITIGDFWGIENYSKKDFIANNGVSLIIFNNEKGKNLQNKILTNSKYEKHLLQNAAKHNQFSGNIICNDNEFYQNLDVMDFDKAVKKVIPFDFKKEIKRVLKKMLPKRVKTWLKKRLKK